MGLARELSLLTCLLILLVLILVINLSLFPAISKMESAESKEILVSQVSKTIRNQEGLQLFKANCAACHNRNMRDDLVGPALGGVRERWQDNDAGIYDFIRNSQVVIKSRDAYATALYAKWKPNEMPPFHNLTDEEVEKILNYIEEVHNP